MTKEIKPLFGSAIRTHERACSHP